MPKELWALQPDSAKSTISQHNCQYQVNTAQQDNSGHIPKALWDKLPPHAKSAILNAQHHTKQQANSTTAHSNDHTEHSVADTYLCVPLILYITCLWKQPHLLNLLHYLIP